MNKDDFLRGLQNALSGEVPPTVVRDNLKYYDDYIKTELQNGREEEQVMDELGDPRLIARTIIDTTPGAGEGGFEEYRSFGNFGFGGGSSAESYGSEPQAEPDSRRQSGHGNIHYYDLNKWYWKLAGIVLIILIVMLIVMVITGILSILIPLVPFFIITMVLMWFFNGGSRR